MSKKVKKSCQMITIKNIEVKMLTLLVQKNHLKRKHFHFNIFKRMMVNLIQLDPWRDDTNTNDSNVV